MTDQEAFDALGLTVVPPSPEAVKAAFRALLRAAHPDTGGSADDLERLTIARDVALEVSRAAPCPRCGGSKRVAVGKRAFVSSTVLCPDCSGTGKRFPSSAGSTI